MIQTLSPTALEQAWQIEQLAHAFPWTKSQLAQQLEKKNLNFGIWENQILVSFVCTQRIFPEAEILNIATHPKHQGKGIGKKLLDSLMKQLKNEHFERIYLEVRTSNQRAIDLYESLGFNQIGERPNYYPTKKGREDALLYAIEL